MKQMETSWKSYDGLTLYAQRWEPDSLPIQEVVCLVHGLGDHSGRFAHVADAFVREGYALFAADLRGHGRSEGPKGHAPSMEALLKDVDVLLKQAQTGYPAKPIVLYGHSLGGIIVLNYVLTRKPMLKGVLVTSPALHSSLEEKPAKVLAAKILGSLAPQASIVSGLDVMALSHDPAVIEAYRNDPLVHDRISLGLGKTLLQACRYNLTHARDLTLPMLLMHGKQDAIAYPSSSIEFAAGAGEKCRLLLWEDGFHELHNEPFQDDVFEAMIQWLNTL